jgi:hypothetical protein
MKLDAFRVWRLPVAGGERQVLLAPDGHGLPADAAMLAPAHRALLVAYLQANYEVGIPARFTLHVDAPSRGLQDLQRALRVDCAAYVTAWNPMSEVTPPAANAAAHERLVAAVRERSLASLDGEGKDPSGQWPGEHSLLVPGLALADAVGLARRFRQAGILWADVSAVPRLCILDLPPPATVTASETASASATATATATASASE